MEILYKLVYAVMLLSALGVVGLVLLQHGKGADMGTGFGAGSSGSLFGASGSANFLSRTTAILATVFFVCTLALAHFATNQPKSAGVGVMEGVTTKPAAPQPASGVPVDPVPAAPAPAGVAAPAAVPAAPAKSTDVPK